MTPATNKWPKTSSGHDALFAAQLMREMLDQSTYESFRVPTLNLVSRAVELLNLCENAQKGRVPVAAINPVLDEFRWSLSNDPIVGKIAKKEVDQFPLSVKSLNIQNPSDLQRLHRLVQVLLHRIYENYADRLKSEIVSSVISNRKEYLRSLLQAFFSMLVSQGWDAFYILTRVNERFFTKEIKRIGPASFRSFLNEFDYVLKPFRVWIPVNRATATFISKLKFGRFKNCLFTDLPPFVAHELAAANGHEEDHRYVKVEVDRLDPQSAISTAFEILSLLTSMAGLQRTRVSLEWKNYAYVVSGQQASGRLLENKGAIFQQEKPVSVSASGKRQKRHVDTLLSKLNKESSTRALQAAQNISVAQSTNNANNQLVLIWSAIETLLSNPPENLARIVFFTDSLAPCICLNYARRYCCAVYDELILHHPSILRKSLKIVKVSRNTDDHSRFIKFMFDEDLAFARMAFINAISDNPLAVNRLRKLRDNFATPSAFLRSLDGHEKRVRWQIGRIYRARNNLVHGGEAPKYVIPLVLNAFEYFKTTFFALLSRAQRFESDLETEMIIASIVFDYECRKTMLSDFAKNPKSCAQADFISLFDRE